MQPTLTIEEVTDKLNAFVLDPTMITLGAYSPSAVDLPGGLLPFVDLHLAYLRSHKNVNASYYLSNLSIMLKKR